MMMYTTRFLTYTAMLAVAVVASDPRASFSAPIRIFVAEESAPCINVMNIDGTDRHSIVSPILNRPNHMAIGPNGHIYWTDWHCNDVVIRRSNPDGSNVEILPIALVHPSEIAIDRATGLLYVADFGLGRILVSSLDGSNTQTLIDYAVAGDICLDPQGGRVYWVGPWTSSGQEVFSADLANGSNPGIVFHASDLGINFVGDIALHPSGQWLFVSGSRMIYRFDLNTQAVTLVLTDERSFVTDLVVMENEFCFSSSDGDPAVRCADLDGSNVRIMADHVGSQGLAFDPSGENLFWSAYVRIQRAEMATGNVTTVREVDLGRMHGIALDLQREKLYWTQKHIYGTSVPSALMRANLDGTNREILIGDGLLDPTSVVVDSVRERIFFVEEGVHGIYVANLDGTELSLLANGVTGYSSNLALDTETGVVYWTFSDTISYFDESLGVAQILRETNLSRALAIDSFEHLVFWSFRDNGMFLDDRGVRRADLDSPTTELTLTNDLHIPTALAVDFVGDRVYWADWSINGVQSAQYDGSDVITVTENVESPVAIAIDWRRDPGDRDGNGLIESVDTNGSYECVGGPDSGSDTHGRWLDLDGDGDVDLADVAAFWVQASQ